MSNTRGNASLLVQRAGARTVRAHHVACVVLLLAFASGCVSSPDPPPAARGSVVVSVDQPSPTQEPSKPELSDGRDIYVVNPKTGDATPLLSARGSQTNAELSPDGRRMVYESRAPGDPSQIVVLAVDGATRKLTNMKRGLWTQPGRPTEPKSRSPALAREEGSPLGRGLLRDGRPREPHPKARRNPRARRGPRLVSGRVARRLPERLQLRVLGRARRLLADMAGVGSRWRPYPAPSSLPPIRWRSRVVPGWTVDRLQPVRTQRVHRQAVPGRAARYPARRFGAIPTRGTGQLPLEGEPELVSGRSLDHRPRGRRPSSDQREVGQASNAPHGRLARSAELGSRWDPREHVSTSQRRRRSSHPGGTGGVASITEAATPGEARRRILPRPAVALPVSTPCLRRAFRSPPGGC